MAYKRKTQDEYQIHGFYKHGWEEITAYNKYSDAKTDIKLYRENEPGISFKIIKKRIKIENLLSVQT